MSIGSVELMGAITNMADSQVAVIAEQPVAVLRPSTLLEVMVKRSGPSIQFLTLFVSSAIGMIERKKFPMRLATAGALRSIGGNHFEGKTPDATLISCPIDVQSMLSLFWRFLSSSFCSISTVALLIVTATNLFHATLTEYADANAPSPVGFGLILIG
jgi:hypothetical protein